jgi:hypothetical protein
MNKYILSLKPTNPLRDIINFKKGYDLFCGIKLKFKLLQKIKKEYHE